MVHANESRIACDHSHKRGLLSLSADVGAGCPPACVLVVFNVIRISVFCQVVCGGELLSTALSTAQQTTGRWLY